MGARGAQWVTQCRRVMQRASGKHVLGDRQFKQQAVAQARSEWLSKQRVPLVLDQAVQTGGVQVVLAGAE